MKEIKSFNAKPKRMLKTGNLNCKESFFLSKKKVEMRKKLRKLRRKNYEKFKGFFDFETRV